nr:DUF502 domain-containing protein [Tepidicella baoligensis]
MKRLSQYFLRGLIAILPLGLTVYLLFTLVAWSESFAMQFIRPIVGNFYIPGLGLILTAGLIVLTGFLISRDATARLLNWVELPFTNIPVVKSVYNSLKSFADYFSPQHRGEATQQVVILRLPNQPLEIVGLITRNHMHGLPPGFLPGDRVAVYLPMGYMIGGYTVFVPREWLTPINMTVEEAMRSSLIAWMSTRKNP